MEWNTSYDRLACQCSFSNHDLALIKECIQIKRKIKMNLKNNIQEQMQMQNSAHSDKFGANVPPQADQKSVAGSHPPVQNLRRAAPHTGTMGLSAQSDLPSESPTKTLSEALELHFKRNKHFVLIENQQNKLTQNAMIPALHPSSSLVQRESAQPPIDSQLIPSEVRKLVQKAASATVIKPAQPQPQQNFYMQALKRDFLVSRQQQQRIVQSISAGTSGEQQQYSASPPHHYGSNEEMRGPQMPPSQQQQPHPNQHGQLPPPQPPSRQSQFCGAAQADRQDSSEKQSAAGTAVGALQDMQNRDSEIRMNSTQEAYQPSQDSCGTQEKLDQILERIMTGNHNIQKVPTSQFANEQVNGDLQMSDQQENLEYCESRMRDALGAVADATNQVQSPFQKCIDKVLSYQELTDVRIKQLDKPLPSLAIATLESLPQEMTQMIKSMTFLVKFRGISHLHCQWMPGVSIVENFDAKSIQTLIQFLQYALQNREKLNCADELGSGQFPGNQSQNIDNNTFLSSFLQSKKVSNFLDIQSATHPFFNPEFLKVEEILCTSTMYPLLHQSGIQQVANSWKDECLRVLDVLLNVQKDNTSFGLKFSAFDPALEQKDLEQQRSKQVERLFGQQSLQVVNMTQLQNLLYNKGLGRPYQFWVNLGKIFKGYILLDANEQGPNRQFCALLRTLALHLFRKWQLDCQESYQSFLEDLQSCGKRSDQAYSSHQLQANKNRAQRHQKQQASSYYQNERNQNQLQGMTGANEDQMEGDSAPPKIKLEDLQVFQQILNQNEKILTIQSKLNFTQKDNMEVESLSQTLNLFMENQRLLQNLLLNFQRQHPQINLYEKDVVAARTSRMGTNDQELTDLRNKLLTQNSYALEQLTRRKILGSSDSGSTSQKKSYANALISGSDSSSLEKPPIFIFNLLQGSQQPLIAGSSPPQPSQSSGNGDAAAPGKAAATRSEELKARGGEDDKGTSSQRRSEDQAEHLNNGISNVAATGLVTPAALQLQQQDEVVRKGSNVLVNYSNLEGLQRQPSLQQPTADDQQVTSPLKHNQHQSITTAIVPVAAPQSTICQQQEKLNAARTAMEALTASHAANGSVNPEFSVLQATIKSFLSQAKQLSATKDTPHPSSSGIAAATSSAGGNNNGTSYHSSSVAAAALQHSSGDSLQQQPTPLIAHPKPIAANATLQQSTPQHHQQLLKQLQRQSSSISMVEKQLQLQLQPQQQYQVTEEAAPMQVDTGEPQPVASNSSGGTSKSSPPVPKHELSWLLFEGETENEILANPYIFKDEVESLLQGLFEKEQSQEGDSGQSFDIQHYYLNRPHLRGATRPSASSSMQQVRDFDSLSFEPLFLVKWKLLSYAEISWEPLSALKGDNLRQVKDFLSEKRVISMRGRLLNSKMINNQAQLLKVQQEMLRNQESVSYAKIFSQQKKLLDQFFQSLVRELITQRSSGEEGKKEKKTAHQHELILKSKNFKLLELQKRSLNSLEQAFFANKNIILADQKGLGKRITLINFLSNLKCKHKISGPFLIITTKEKLSHWRYLLDKWTELKTLTYHDQDAGKTGMENLRKWAVYHLDVTIKGRMTTRNQLHKFDVLLTLAEHINNEEEVFLQKVPFMQVIVDNAELAEQREATKRIACKRIICSTSNPMERKVGNLADLIQCINPKAMDKMASPPERVFGDIASLSQVQSLWSILSPSMIKSFQYELENLFGQLNQIEIDVQMTACQRLFYKEIYEQHGNLLTKLGSLDGLSSNHIAQLEKINDLLLKCCNSVFLIDKDEKLFEKCHQFSKRELKSNLKQQLVSGKMLILQQIVENLQMSSKKMIICSHYPQMLCLLKKYFKETGVACFMFQPLMSIDSVFRFNLYSGQAVFLLHLGQRWTKQECSYFDLDFIQNVVIFDQFGAHENDLINLFQVCTLPFSIDVNIYRLISENSYEQKLFQRQCRSRKLQNVIFNQRNLWQRQDFVAQMRLEFPLQLTTSEECNDYNDIFQMPIAELDVLFKLSCEQVVLFNSESSKNGNDRRGGVNSSNNGKSGKASSKEQLCFTQNYIELLTQAQKPPQLSVLLDRAKAKNQLRNSDRLKDLYETLKSLDESKIQQMPPLKSANFYYKIFGLDYGAGTVKEQTCKHVTCSQFFIDKLSEQSSSVVPNQASLVSKTQNGQQEHFRSFSRTRTRNSNNISLVKLLKSQGQLGRQHKQKTLFSLDFMKQSPSAVGGNAVNGVRTDIGGHQQGRGGQPVVNIWKNMNGESDLQDSHSKKVNQLNVGTPTQPQHQHLPGNSQLALISSTANNGKLLSSINRVRHGATPQDKQANANAASGKQHESATQQMLVDNTNGVVVGSGPAVIGHDLDTSQGYGSAGHHGKRKSLSEQGQQDQQQLGFNDDEDIKILKAQKKTSENNTNTMKQSLDPQQQQQEHQDGPNDESDDRTIEMQNEESTGRRSDGLVMAPAEQSSEMNGRPLELNQPDKKLSNGNVCQICYFLVDDAKQSKLVSKEPVLKCEGPCKNYFHGECARAQGLVVPGSVKPIPQKPKLVKAIHQQQHNSNSNGSNEGYQSHEVNHRKPDVVIESFICQFCHRNEAPCYICKKFDQISSQTNPKEKTASQSGTIMNGTKCTGKSGAYPSGGGNGVKSPSNSGGRNELYADEVEKCIVGSCQKYYHFSCLQQNQNVDIYTNNKNQTRFRCPLHYCSGCSISGNSVQILQCVACPTSYHLKCFRADRGAVKLTKKFILCGQHQNLLKQMQRKRNGGSGTTEAGGANKGAKTSIAGYSLEQKIEQHKRHYHQLHQIQVVRSKQSNSNVVGVTEPPPAASQTATTQQINTMGVGGRALGAKQTFGQRQRSVEVGQQPENNKELMRARKLKADLKTLQRHAGNFNH